MCYIRSGDENTPWRIIKRVWVDDVEVFGVFEVDTVKGYVLHYKPTADGQRWSVDPSGELEVERVEGTVVVEFKE